MKTFCTSGAWKCIHQTKWVNNLKLAANRRAVVSDNIIVTPYDFRFPKAAIWAGQMLKDVLSLVESSLVIGSAAALVFLVFPLVSA